MRLNKYLALHTRLSRRAADAAIEQGRVVVNQTTAVVGQTINDSDVVKLDDRLVAATTDYATIMFHKPVGYICSRRGQGGQTIYDLLPPVYKQLNPVGRLDKDSSGLLLLTNDGHLANQLAHPRYQKQKRYEITLDKELTSADYHMITASGVELPDGLSKLQLHQLKDGQTWQVTMSEGRNRQIRRTFTALGHRVTSLHRTEFGPYKLGNLKAGEVRLLNNQYSDA